MDALRPLPVIGASRRPTRGPRAVRVESAVEDRRRLVVVSDKPLFFLPDDTAKPRAGYELTVVELLFDAAARQSHDGRAARVKPAPDVSSSRLRRGAGELTVAAPPKRSREANVSDRLIQQETEARAVPRR